MPTPDAAVAARADGEGREGMYTDPAPATVLPPNLLKNGLCVVDVAGGVTLRKAIISSRVIVAAVDVTTTVNRSSECATVIRTPAMPGSSDPRNTKLQEPLVADAQSFATVPSCDKTDILLPKRLRYRE
jgi:hypothetical protein